MSKKVYCIAQFLPKPGQEQALFQVLQALEPNTLREDGCLQYRVTRHIASPFAEGESFPIVFNEIWQDMAAFEAHCQRAEIKAFFERYCLAEDGLAAKWNVCVYSDEPEQYDAPRKEVIPPDCQRTPPSGVRCFFTPALRRSPPATPLAPSVFAVHNRP